MIKPLPIQVRRAAVCEAAAQRNHRPRVRSSARIQKQHEKARLDRFGSLPPELKMEVTKWMNLEDLGNLIEVVSKIGLDRAIKLDHTCGPSEDMVWINETVIDRLDELFDDLEKILRKGGRLPTYGFGVTVGLLPEDIVDEGIEMFGI